MTLPHRRRPTAAGRTQGGRRRHEWLYAVAVCGGLLISARAVRLADGPQFVVSVLAALAFGAVTVFILRRFRPATPTAVQLIIGAGVAIGLFAGWYFYLR